jgi:hypothetical protein
VVTVTLEVLVAGVQPILENIIGPALTDRASTAAPDPRPPQPTRANWMVLFSPAYMRDVRPPTRAEVAASRPVFIRNSRRDVLGVVSLIVNVLLCNRVCSIQLVPTHNSASRLDRL